MKIRNKTAPSTSRTCLRQQRHERETFLIYGASYYFVWILNLFWICAQAAQQCNVAYFGRHLAKSSLALQQDTHGGGLPLIPSTKKAKHKPYGDRVDAAHIYVPLWTEHCFMVSLVTNGCEIGTVLPRSRHALSSCPSPAPQPNSNHSLQVPLLMDSLLPSHVKECSSPENPLN
jgi:hypothetical protein